MRVPPSQSLTTCAAARSACSRRFSRSARVTRVSRVPKVKVSTCGAACVSACASARFSSVRCFIEPETSISSSSLRGRGRRRSRLSLRNSPSLRTLSRSVRRRSANGPRRARIRRWPRRSGRRRGASRASRRSGSLAPPRSKRRSTSASARAAAWPDSLTSSANSGVVLAAGVLLDAQRLVALAFRLQRLAAEEMDAEQRVVGGAALRRDAERREARLPDVLQRARPEQADGGKERRCLFRRDGEAVGAQQRDEIDEGARRAREGRRARSRRRLGDQRVEARAHVGEVLLVLQRDADGAPERVRPARAALVEQASPPRPNRPPRRCRAPC